MASDSDPAAGLLVPGLPALLDDIDEAVIVHDASGRIRLLNTAARLLFPSLDLGAELQRSGEKFVIAQVHTGERLIGHLAEKAVHDVLGVMNRVSGAIAEEIEGAESRDGDDQTAGGSDKHLADRRRKARRIPDAGSTKFLERFDHAGDRA